MSTFLGEIDFDRGTVAVTQLGVDQYTGDYWKAERFVMLASKIARQQENPIPARERLIRELFAAEFG